MNHVGETGAKIISNLKPDGYPLTTDRFKLKIVFKNESANKVVTFRGADTTEKGRLILLDGKKSLTLTPTDDDSKPYLDVDVTVAPSKNAIKCLSKLKGCLFDEIVEDLKKPEPEPEPEPEEPKAPEPEPCQTPAYGGNCGNTCGCCHFPFMHNDTLHTKCTNVNSNHYWCATTPNYDTDQQWSYCSGIHHPQPAAQPASVYCPPSCTHQIDNCQAVCPELCCQAAQNTAGQGPPYVLADEQTHVEVQQPHQHQFGAAAPQSTVSMYPGPNIATNNAANGLPASQSIYPSPSIVPMQPQQLPSDARGVVYPQPHPPSPANHTLNVTLIPPSVATVNISPMHMEVNGHPSYQPGGVTLMNDNVSEGDPFSGHQLGAPPHDSTMPVSLDHKDVLGSTASSLMAPASVLGNQAPSGVAGYGVTDGTITNEYASGLPGAAYNSPGFADGYFNGWNGQPLGQAPYGNQQFGRYGTQPNYGVMNGFQGSAMPGWGQGIGFGGGPNAWGTPWGAQATGAAPANGYLNPGAYADFPQNNGIFNNGNLHRGDLGDLGHLDRTPFNDPLAAENTGMNPLEKIEPICHPLCLENCEDHCAPVCCDPQWAAYYKKMNTGQRRSYMKAYKMKALKAAKLKRIAAQIRSKMIMGKLFGNTPNQLFKPQNELLSPAANKVLTAAQRAKVERAKAYKAKFAQRAKIAASKIAIAKRYQVRKAQAEKARKRSMEIRRRAEIRRGEIRRRGMRRGKRNFSMEWENN